MSTVPRRRGEYFHRPPVLAPYDRVPGLDILSYTYLYGENGESEYCDQCRFCSQQGRWCGRRPVSQSIKIPKQVHRSASEKESGFEKQFKSFNATWVQEPLIVNAAHVSDENSDPREPFQPAVFVGFRSRTTQNVHPTLTWSVKYLNADSKSCNKSSKG